MENWYPRPTYIYPIAISEIAETLNTKDTDIAFFTETWLKNSVPDEAINIAGYHLLRRDRKQRAHGGVCLYAKNSFACRPLLELQSEDFEVLWTLVQAKRLPRGFSNIVVGFVYNSPDADCSAMSSRLLYLFLCVWFYLLLW